MIRFFDKEVACISEGDMDRQVLVSYFLDGHRDEPVCVLDETGKFIGMVTYTSLMGRDLAEAYECDFVVMDEYIWENGREFFKRHETDPLGRKKILPVVDREHRLMCFAWEDWLANREIRMLWELMEQDDALGFSDVYPEYDCVTIYECNELAYYLLQYLRKLGIPVNTCGKVWEELGIYERADAVPEYRNFVVYGEGVGLQQEDIELRESVSVEFELIDHIYEENICSGKINDAVGTIYNVLDRIKGRQIVMIGTDQKALDAYDFIMGKGVDICCFIEEDPEKWNKVILGKRVISREKALEELEDGVFINVNDQHSAWGFGETDFYHYMGYKRNESFFLLRDYIEVPCNGLQNILKHLVEYSEQRVILLGDMWLCRELQRRIGDEKILCDDTFEIKDASEDETGKDDVYLYVLPEHYGYDLERKEMIYQTIHKNCQKFFLEKGLTNATEYIMPSLTFLENKSDVGDCTDSTLKVGKVIIGANNTCSGNVFFRGILDNHPNIIVMDYGDNKYLNNNLHSICIRLALEEKSDIISSFWKLCSEDMDRCNVKMKFPNKELFEKSMARMIEETEVCTSQDLFVMIHIAYAQMWGKKIGTLSDMVIYWEPHTVDKQKVEEYADWLGGVAPKNYIVNVTRNAYIRSGSSLGSLVRLEAKIWQGNILEALGRALNYPNQDKKEYEGWERMVLRFEDLKCNAQEELLKLCNKLDIPWSDTLLETTSNGAKSSFRGVSGFDLAPVYRTYEEYFSEFDRFRISLIVSPWQRMYGYPYVNFLNFSRRELQEMFLKAFRFEEKIVYQDEEQRIRVHNARQNLVDFNLQKTRRKEVLREKGRI